LTVFTSD